ncbi:hypothetical protein BD408DRAFT_431192 [Parasitella parasitica]|nr:hypothetical protein BD408DRAFT_431192 [Parasitella parasitica]
MTDLQEKPPPYDTSKSAYSQFVDKLIDSTASRFGYHLSSRVVDRKSLSQGVRLVEIAVDEFETGNEAIGLDVYLAGLDKIIMALPNLKEIKTKEALRERLTSLEGRVGISTQQSASQQESSTAAENEESYQTTIISKFYAISQLLAPSWLAAMAQNSENNDTAASKDTPIQKFKLLSSAMTDIIVRCVVLFKQSPVPGLLYAILSYFLYAIFWINGQFQIVQKVEYVTIECIKFALKTDEKYNLHEIASEAVCTLLSTFLKAIIAYREAPRHKNTLDEGFSAISESWIWGLH